MVEGNYQEIIIKDQCSDLNRANPLIYAFYATIIS